jgi:hypothetical protein
MKEKKYKINFKKGEKATGLARVCSGTPNTTIKYKGNTIGYIAFNDSWSSRGKGIEIYYKRKVDTKSWKWERIKGEFKNENEARAEIQKLRNLIIDSVFLEKEND